MRKKSKVRKKRDQGWPGLVAVLCAGGLTDADARLTVTRVRSGTSGQGDQRCFGWQWYELVYSGSLGGTARQFRRAIRNGSDVGPQNAVAWLMAALHEAGLLPSPPSRTVESYLEHLGLPVPRGSVENHGTLWPRWGRVASGQTPTDRREELVKATSEWLDQHLGGPLMTTALSRYFDATAWASLAEPEAGARGRDTEAQALAETGAHIEGNASLHHPEQVREIHDRYDDLLGGLLRHVQKGDVARVSHLIPIIAHHQYVLERPPEERRRLSEALAEAYGEGEIPVAYGLWALTEGHHTGLHWLEQMARKRPVHAPDFIPELEEAKRRALDEKGLREPLGRYLRLFEVARTALLRLRATATAMEGPVGAIRRAYDEARLSARRIHHESLEMSMYAGEAQRWLSIDHVGEALELLQAGHTMASRQGNGRRLTMLDLGRARAYRALGELHTAQVLLGDAESSFASLQLGEERPWYQPGLGRDLARERQTLSRLLR